MSEELKAISGRFFEAIASNDQLEVEELLAPDFVIHVPGTPGTLDRAAHMLAIRNMALGLSEVEVTIENQIAEGNQVSTRVTWRGTHTGIFRDTAATGNQILIVAMATDRIEDGKIAERWYMQDELGLLLQLGALASP